MNRIEPAFSSAVRIGHSVCPHDCPSTCALEVELLDDHTIGRVRGARENTYTLGVICEKVARYAERIHHSERLLHPLKRKGGKDMVICPVVLGNGRPLFAGNTRPLNMKLLGSKALDRGGVLLEYREGGR